MATLLQRVGGRARFEAWPGPSHVMDVYRQAEPIELEDGRTWYHRAHRTLAAMSRATGSTVEAAAAVCARLSPQVAWRDNLAATSEVLRAAVDGEEPTGPALANCYPYNIACAAEIATAVHVGPARLRAAIADNVLPDGPNRQRPKIAAFFDNLYRPDSSPAVTVDTWMVRVWIGDVASPALSVTPRQCERIAADVSEAARRVDLAPLQMQAVVWIAAHRLATGPNGILPFDVAPKIDA